MYELEMWDDGGSVEKREFERLPTTVEVEEEIEDWVEGGEWGEDGASIEVTWKLTDLATDEVVDEKWHTVAVPPDHDALIRRAGGDTDCDHEWTSEGEGGCNQNPGVWSTGGTTMVFTSHCRNCGLHKTETALGSQRNPGEHDRVSYSVSDD